MYKFKERSPAHRYLVALVTPALVAGVVQITWPFFERSPLALFFLAVMFSAWYGGIGPGLLSLVFSLLLGDFFFISPFHTLSPKPERLARLVTFTLVSAAICVMCGLMRWGQRRLQLALDASRASEERYRKLAENFPNGAVITYDRDLRVTFIAGMDLAQNNSSAESYLGRLFEEIAPPDVVALVKPHFAAAFAGHTEIYECPFPDGRVYLAAVAPLLDMNGLANEILVICQNLTEHKLAEEKLKQSESLLAEAQHQARLGSWTHNLATHEVSRSDELFRLYGIQPQQAGTTYEAFLDRVHPDDRARVEALAHQAIISQQSCDFEYRIVRPDGSVRTFYERIFVTPNEDGKTVRLFGTTQDITERKQANEALREAESKYRNIFENAVEGIFQTSPDGRFVVANPALAKMFGFDSPEELIEERSDISKQHYVDPKRRDEFKRLLEKAGVVHNFEYEGYRKDGRKIWISDNVRAVRDQDGQVVCYEGTATDITERKRTEEALRASEERYRELFESARDAIYVHDLNGRYVSVNRAAEKLSGYPRAEIIGKHFSDFVAPEQVDDVRQKLMRKLITQQGLRYTVQIISRDGRRVPVEVNNNLIYENGVPVGVQGMARDITQRRRAEQALREAERKYREIFENAKEGMFQATPSGLFITANPALARMFGFDSPAELLEARTSVVHYNDVDPQRRKEFLRELECWGAVNGFEYKASRRDGSKFWISENVRAVVDENCKLTYFEGTAVDVTERKSIERALRDSEQRFRAMFEQSAVSMARTDAQGRFLQVNAALCDFLGYSEAELLNLTVIDVAHPKDRVATQRRLAEARTDLRGPGDHEKRYVHKDGTVLWGHTKVVWLLGTDSLPTYSIAVIQDITKQKLAHDALQNFSRRLIEAQEMERQNIARELHDQVGQLLTAIRINLQNLREAATLDTSKPLIDEGMDLLDLAVEEVRDLSFELRPSLLDDLGLVAAMRWYTDRFAKRTAIPTTIVTSIPEGVRLKREIETACFRIIQEALTNVARHSRAKSVSINLKTLGSETVLLVKDDGIGFDPYSVNPQPFPIGLGLRGMEERALALGGRLEVKTQLHQGTELRACFPQNGRTREWAHEISHKEGSALAEG
jgi:PAS domain S-box-containing protein